MIDLCVFTLGVCVWFYSVVFLYRGGVIFVFVFPACYLLLNG